MATAPRTGRTIQAPGPGDSTADVQRVLLSIWERVLSLEGIGPHDDVFTSGADQFAVTRALELVEDAFGVRLDVATVVRAPSVSALTPIVEGACADARADVDPDAATPTAGVPGPVAFSQEGMLWHEHFVPGSQNLPPLVRRYEGPLDVDVLDRVLTEIVRRHEPLRTTFEVRAGRPVQIVAPAARVRLAVHELQPLGRIAGLTEVARLLEVAGRPFDLARGPLFDPSVIRLGPEEHLVVLRVHHAVFDDWSVGVFRRELVALYTAFAAGNPSPLPEPTARFSAFARGQRRRLAGPVGTAQLAWWRTELAGAPLCLQLPIDDPDRPEGAAQASAEPVSADLDPHLAAQLRALAGRERTTPFIAMLAAFGVLVQRHSGQSDLLLASVVANRNRLELEELIGCFTKKVLVRLRLHGDPSFAELCIRARDAVVGSMAHQDLAFETVLQQVLGPDAARHGLVPYPTVLFQGVAPRAEAVEPAGLRTRGLDTAATTARAHFAAGSDDSGSAPPPVPWGAGLYSGTFLILSVLHSPAEPGAATSGGISLVARGAFHRPSVQALLESFIELLAELVAHPHLALSDLATHLATHPATHPATHLATRGHDGSDRDPAPDGAPAPRGAAGLFAARVARSPDATAITSGARRLSFAQLDAEAEGLANRLRVLGTRPGALVGVALEASIESVVAVLAIWKLGAGFVGLDPDDTDLHLIFVVEDADLSVVLTRAHLRRDVVERRARLVAMDSAAVRVVGAGPAADPQPDEPPEGVPATDVDDAGGGCTGDIATVFYGSGATEVDHGVVLGHPAMVQLVAGLRASIFGPEVTDGARRRVCLSASPTQDGFLRQMAALLAGHSLDVAGPSLASAPAEVVDRLGDGRVDVVDCTESEWALLAGAGLADALRQRIATPGAEPATLVIGTRGAALAATSFDPTALADQLGSDRIRTHQLYGPPECGFAATFGPAPAPGRRSTVGRPLPNVRAVVLGPDGRPVPGRVTGELHVGGAGLASGYHRAPAGTEARFVPGPGGARMARALFRSGWMARSMPDGSFELLGAVDDTLELGGFRLDRGRMHRALRACPGSRSVRVEVRPGERGEPILAAHVVPAGDGPPSLADLRTALWVALAGYAWPAAMMLAGPGATRAGALDAHPVAPDAPTSAARVLASVWAEVLGIDRVDPGQNYWQHFSFLDVVARARRSGLVIGGPQVTRNRTVEALAADVAAASVRT